MQRPAELSVFRGKDARKRAACLQKQKSLTNLTLLSEGEKRYPCRENWFGNASKSSQASYHRETELGSRPSLSKALSKSAHSLYYASNKSPWEMEELPPVGGRKPNKRLRDCPTEESSQGEKSSFGDENVPFRSNFTGQKWVEEEEEGCLREGTAQLDEDVIITMLGDLEQVLYNDFLGEDPEARRMRTVKNIADLRQNLEETMSSLRGTQISHSTLETTFDSTVTTEVNGRSIPGLTSRSSPVTWRLGQASPRLQAGDAPSLGGGYPRSGASRFIHTDPSRFMYTTPLRRAAVSRLGNIPQIDISEKGNSDLDISSDVDVGGYMSDGDILGKSLRADDINSGYMTDGGLNLYTRSLNRIPDIAASRDVIQRGVHDVTVDADR
ncbi:Neuron navigator 3 [Varanus komodoensis]|nr:Neuron navigator 3 [Varanus komodoensis]